MKEERLRAEFQRNFTERGEVGASMAIWQEGRPLVELSGGFQDREGTIPWTDETPVLFWSATKAVAVACLLQVCEAEALPLSTRVAAVWPEFAAAGKAEVTLAQLLSHQAGLPALAAPVPALDYEAVVAALAAQAPEWPPGEAHGYHPRTFGYLLDELVRRLTGQPLQGYWRESFAEPLGLDLWMGVPREVAARVAPILPARRAPPPGDPFYTAFLTPGSLSGRSFASPRGLHSAAQMNAPEIRMTSLPAFGGIGTARSLAKFYALLAEGGTLEGRRYLKPETVRLLQETVVQGPDRVLLAETAFSTGLMKDPVGANGRKQRTIFGPSLTAFGQPGAGGSQAFADPEHRLAFAYVMNQMEPGVLPNAKSLRLIEAMYAE